MISESKRAQAHYVKDKKRKIREDLSNLKDYGSETEVHQLLKNLGSFESLEEQMIFMKDYLSAEPLENSRISAVLFLYFHLPLKSVLGKVIGSSLKCPKENFVPHFLEKWKLIPTSLFVENLLKIARDGNHIFLENLSSLNILDIADVVFEYEKLNESEFSRGLRALLFLQAHSVTSLIHNSSNDFYSICHRLIRNKSLSQDTRGEVAQVLIKEELKIHPAALTITKILHSLEDPTSAYYCFDAEDQLIYCHGLITSSILNQNIIESLFEVYVQASAQTDLSPSAVLVLSRGLLKCGNLLANINISSLKIKDFLLKFENYVWKYLEHPIDSVKHNVRNSVKDFIIIIERQSECLENFLNKILSQSNEQKKKYIILLPVIKTLGRIILPYVFKNWQNFKEILIGNLSDPVLRTSCSELYKICYDNSEEDDSWGWLHPVITGYSVNRSDQCRKSRLDLLMRHILSRVGSSECDKLVECIFNEGKSTSTSVYIILQALNCLKHIKGSDVSFKIDSFLEECFIDFNDEVRLEVLDLVCSSAKTTQILTENELNYIFMYGIKTNMSLSNPPLKQKFLSIIKRLLTRLKEGAQVFKRQDKHVDLTRYKTFLSNVVNWIVIGNLSKNHSSVHFRTAGFEVLLLMIVIFKDLKDIFLLTTEHGIVLVECLRKETHDKNCTIILEIIANRFCGDPSIVNYDVETILFLCRSPMPRNASIACHLSKIFRICRINDVQSFEESIFKEFIYQLETAKKSLKKASLECPVYGILVCLLDGPYLEKCFEKYFELWELVSHIVNNSSPEGYIYSSEEGTSDAQLILLLSWRSSKEICEAFKHILALEGTSRDGCDLLKIADHFVDVLSETKHRGVFERASLGFTYLCSVFWSHPNKVLRKYCKTLLKDTIYSLSSTNDDALVTRRSAGFPFLIQALLSTEPERQSFDGIMEQLLGWIRGPSSSPLIVHACNILRVLFRDSNLSERVMRHVTEGLKVAIIGFGNKFWPVRNACTLLFSSLITRIFGVKRDKDDLSFKNGSITPKAFFEKFSGLYEFFLNNLKISAGSSDLRVCAAVYPTLLVLAKLKPSLIQDCDNKQHDISPFYILVIDHFSSPIIKIRQLASHALIALLPTQNYSSITSKIIKSLHEEKVSSNFCHGALLTLNLMSKYSDDVKDILESESFINETFNWNMSPVILAEVIKLPICSLNKKEKKEFLISEGRRLSKGRLDEPGRNIYFRSVISELVEFVLLDEDYDLADYLISNHKHNYFEILLEKPWCRIKTWSFLGKNYNSEVALSSVGENEFNCFLKGLMILENCTKISEALWQKMVCFCGQEDTLHRSTHLFESCLRVMTIAINSPGANMSQKRLLFWAEILKKATFEEVSLRKTAASLILKSAHWLKEINSDEHALISFNLWYAVLVLSWEEDVEIQLAISNCLGKVTGSKKSTATSLFPYNLTDWLINHSIAYIPETFFVLYGAYNTVLKEGKDEAEESNSSLAFEKCTGDPRHVELGPSIENVKQFYETAHTDDSRYTLLGFINSFGLNGSTFDVDNFPLLRAL